MEPSIQDFLNSGAILSLGKGQVMIAWGHAAFRTHRDERKFCVYAPDYFLTSPLPWIIYDQWITLDKVNLHRLLVPWALLFLDEVKWQAPLRSEFREDFDGLQRAIQKGELQKGVPYVFEQGTIHTSLGWRARTLINLLEQPETSRIYGMWHAHEGIVGATPETLFEIRPGPQLYTMALAGTQAIEEDRQSFLRDFKQVHEHRVVVDDIIERLQSLGNVRLEPMRTLELPRLRHLLTEISVDLNRAVSFDEAAHLLHPTPALGAAPRGNGWRWLQQLERHRPRKRFGAPFGISLDGIINTCLVAIRNVQWHGDDVWLGAGCGVVSESRFESEWDELELKREATKRMLGL